MSQDSICNDLHIQVLFSVMLEKYFKIAVQVIINSFTFLVLLKKLKFVEYFERYVRHFGILQTSRDVKTTKLTTS